MTSSSPSCSSPCQIPFCVDVTCVFCFLGGFSRCDRVGSGEKLVRLVAGSHKRSQFAHRSRRVFILEESGIKEEFQNSPQISR